MATNYGAKRALTDSEKLARIAVNTWPLRPLFASRGTQRTSEATAAMRRVMESITRFLSKRLKLAVNQSKSAVARTWLSVPDATQGFASG